MASLHLRSTVTAVILLAVAGCAEKSPTTTTQPAASASFATTRQLMLALVVPTSNAVFAAAGEPPADEAAWAALEANALVLAESGALLHSGPRAVDRGSWIQFSDALIKAAQSAAHAAHDKNVEALPAASDQVYEVCEGCHKQYLSATPSA
jgi:hypothetical protein